ncbi:hypothetical protein Ciccas_011789, partial [Cichlidogyrus casuarinus]
KCAKGYGRNAQAPTKCEPICTCSKCDEKGNCIMCEESSTGPRCRQCETGYYRPLNGRLHEKCNKCEECGRYAYVDPSCVADVGSLSGYRCKCETKSEGKLISAGCDICKRSEETGLPVPKGIDCEKRPDDLSDCNFDGTKNAKADGTCECTEGYSGDKCDECVEGFFKFQNKCLKCFCSGKSDTCELSKDHSLKNYTLVNPGEYKFDVVLGSRTQFSSSVIERLNANGKERVTLLPEGAWVVKDPLIDRGVALLLVLINKTNYKDSGVSTYNDLYGGSMSFRLDSPLAKLSQISQMQERVVIEIESFKFGRAWTEAIYNPNYHRYEVQFTEYWWAGGWRTGQDPESRDKLSRGALIRFLSTAKSVNVALSSLKNEIEMTKLSGLSLRISSADGSGDPAPVEICTCPEVEEAVYSTSCQLKSCSGKRSEINKTPLGDDFMCATATESENGCEPGSYKYDVLTGEDLPECRKGLEIYPKSQVIYAPTGSPVDLLCRAVSYTGGIPYQEWFLPDGVKSQWENSRAMVVLPDRIMSDQILRIANVQEADSGVYRCSVANLGGNVTEVYQLVVRPYGYPIEETSDDELNKKFPVPKQIPRPFAKVKDVSISSKPNSEVLTFSGNIELEPRLTQPSDMDPQMIWVTPKGYQLEPLDGKPLTLVQGPFVIEMSSNKTQLKQSDGFINGYVVGFDPIRNPSWIPIATPERALPYEPETGEPQKLRRNFKIPGKS